MNRSTLALAALVAAGVVTFSYLPRSGARQDSARQKPAQPDLSQHQSPAKPTPDWVKYIDQGDNDPRLKGYLTPEGLKVEIVAEDPVVVNPVGRTFGPDGTLYVLEWVPGGAENFPESYVVFTYKDGTKRKVAVMKKPVKDLVKTLSFNAAQGKYDKAQVVLEEELPSSILIHDGWLYVSGQGSVRRYRQSKAGGAYDTKEVIAQGFCGFHHHQVSGLTIGNDGWLYITSGDDDNVVEGSDGSRATVLRTGAIFRCRPDGSQMHAFAMGFRNPYRDVSFDAAFNMFHADNDNEDGSKFMGCRLMHVTEGNDFGWRLRIGARCCVPDHVRGAAFGELPGKMTPLLKTGRGSPAGLMIYNETRFPKQYRGLLYYPDVFRKLIRAYQVEPRGASFEVTHEFEFMKSNDPLFRPCQMVVGPDGAMYVCDWRTDSGGAGKLWGDGKHGRIYRITWAGTKEDAAIAPRGLDSWASIAAQDDEELLKTLLSEDFTDRQKAQWQLVKRGGKNRPALLKLLKQAKAPQRGRIAALGALEQMWDKDVSAAFVELLTDADPDIRRLVADGLALNTKPRDRGVHEELVRVLNDDDPLVRRTIALAIARIGAPGAEDVLVNAVQFDKARDEYLFDGLIRALENTGKPGMEKLLALADSGDAKSLERVVEVFQSLRTRPAYEALGTLLKNYHLTPEQKAALLRSYNNYLLDPPISLEPVADYLLALPKAPAKGLEVPPALAKELEALTPVKLAGLEVLSTGGVLNDVKVQRVLLNMLDEKHADVRLAVIKAVEQTRLTKAGPQLAGYLTAKDCPAPERLALVKALGALREPAAVPSLKAILQDGELARAPGGPALRLEALRALGATDPAAAREFAIAFLDQTDQALRLEAIQALAALPEGAKLLGQRFLEKKLPRELLPQVADALRLHAAKSPELADMLTEVMKGGLLVSLDAKEVERINQLVAKQGNAKRGRELYLNNKALACITCHRLEGVGGNIGPDLTRIWDTMSLEKLMESIIDPSKEIKEGYQSYVATTTKGQIYTGLKVSQNADEVVLRDQTGKEIRIAAKDLESLVASKKSLMPDDVVRHLSFNQFLDLLAFLRNRQAQEALRGMALEFWVVGPFTDDRQTWLPFEKQPDPTVGVEADKGGIKLTWAARQADSRGYLDLRAVFNRDKCSAYALTYVYSPKEQTVQMLAGCDDTMRVWLDGKLVHETDKPRPARPDDDRVDLKLAPGWHRVLVRVFNVEGDHGLYLRFAGDGLRTALRPGD